MTGVTSTHGGSDSLPLDKLPKTALQAIYHAVTGKTENWSKTLRGNAIIGSQDLENLYEMLVDQMGHYDLQFDPTVTVVVKCESERSLTYSSWERYKVLRAGNTEVTSEVIIKLEFVVNLPNTPQPQRMVLSVSCDSSLPMIKPGAERERFEETGEFFFFFRNEWQAVTISIDFVDFLIAKIFSQVIEDWFGKVARTPKVAMNEFVNKNMSTIRMLLAQMGRCGMAAFVIGYVLINNWHDQSISKTMVAGALGLIMWSVISVASFNIGSVIMRRVTRNVIPAVILLTGADCKEFEKVLGRTNSAGATMFTVAASVTLAILVNVISSYIYTMMTAH